MRDHKTTRIELSTVPETRVARAPACVIVIHGGELGKRVELRGSPVVIGRDEMCGISIALHTLSRRHARLIVRKRVHYVEDLGSTNGTFVNETRVVRLARLQNGDLVRCGGAVFKFIEGGNVEALYHEEIYRLTITDGLTEIANRRFFADFLEREIARSTRHDRPLSVVMFDVDDFKSTNDRYGHLAGDALLKGIAEVVGTEVRRDELLARCGGDEFAVVMPETLIVAAAAFSERIRSLVQLAVFDFDGESIQTTISIGAASLVASDTFDSLIARADARLYKAKKEGRNRVVAES